MLYDDDDDDLSPHYRSIGLLVCFSAVTSCIHRPSVFTCCSQPAYKYTSFASIVSVFLSFFFCQGNNILGSDFWVFVKAILFCISAWCIAVLWIRRTIGFKGFKVIKRGCSPKSSAFVFQNRYKDSISLC